VTFFDRNELWLNPTLNVINLSIIRAQSVCYGPVSGTGVGAYVNDIDPTLLDLSKNNES